MGHVETVSYSPLYTTIITKPVLLAYKASREEFCTRAKVGTNIFFFFPGSIVLLMFFFYFVVVFTYTQKIVNFFLSQFCFPPRTVTPLTFASI
jgi:hypothetical protein